MIFPLSAAFRADQLSCRRGDRLIFQGLGFSVPPGGALLLLGPNGSGKSSLLRLLAGLLRPTVGEIFWGDQTLREEREAHVGRTHYLGHQDAVKTVLTVEENLTFWACLHDPATAPEKIAAALAAFALTNLASTPGKLLSAGQRRRLALARLLAAPAPLWLLDEPSVGLDRDSLGRLETILGEHRAAGGIVILSTHAEIALPEAQMIQMQDFAPTAEQALGIWA